MRTLPITVRITIYLMWFIAAFWALYAGLVLCDAIPSIPHNSLFGGFLIAAALGASGIVILLSILLARRQHLAFFATLILLVVLAVLSIADDLGWIDLISLVISLVPLVLMIKDRSWYLQQAQRREK